MHSSLSGLFTASCLPRLARSVAAFVLMASVVAGCDCEEQLRGMQSKLAISPDALDFGQVPLGSDVSLSFNLTSASAGAVQLLSVRLETDAAAGGSATDTATDGATDTASDEPSLPVSEELMLATGKVVDCGGRPTDATTLDGVRLTAGQCVRATVRYLPQLSRTVRATLVVRYDDGEEREARLDVLGEGVGPTLCMRLKADALAAPVSAISFVSPLAAGEASEEQTLIVSNCGDVTFDLSSPVVQGDAAFSVAAVEARLMVPGDEVEVPVRFAPMRRGVHEGGLLLQWSWEGKGWRALLPLDGDGTCGAAVRPQVAVSVRAAEADFTASPYPRLLLKDGRTTRVAYPGEPLLLEAVHTPGSPTVAAAQYRWQLFELSGAEPSTRTLLTELTGDPTIWTPPHEGRFVAALVADDLGCVSAPAEIELLVRTERRLEVALSWADDAGGAYSNPHGDLDLHVVRPGGAFGDLAGDCFWQTCIPCSETPATAVVDCSLSLDWTGALPELAGGESGWQGGELFRIINPRAAVGCDPADAACDDAFHVVVNHYCSRSTPTAADAGSVRPRLTVSRWLNGRQSPATDVVTYDGPVIGQGDRWEALGLVVEADGSVALPAAASSDLCLASGCAQEADYCPYR